MGSKNRRVFELRLGKLGLVCFIFGMSILIFSGFLIGVVVGKHMDAYPERYASGIMVMIRDRLLASLPGAGKESADKGAPDPGDEKINLTFFDTLGGKKGGGSPGGQGGSLKESPSGASADQGAPAADPLKKKAVAPPVEAARQKASPAPAGEDGTKRAVPPAHKVAGAAGTQIPPPPAAEPQTKKTPAGKSRFEIQAAAYREQEQAEQLAKKIMDLGFVTRVVMKEIPGKGTWFRVIAEGFESREQAQEASERMAAGIRGLKCVIRPSGGSGDEN
ncbi:MAG: SPOR domain-containing protein [Thermodesulfobacteriota bacterium]